MLHKKITAVLLIVLFQQIGAASAYAQDNSTGDAMVNAAIKDVEKKAKSAASSNFAKTAKTIAKIVIEHPEIAIEHPKVKRGRAAIRFAHDVLDAYLRGRDVRNRMRVAAERRAEAERAERRNAAVADRAALDRRLKRQNLREADFLDGRDLRSPGALAQAQADLRRELLRRELRERDPDSRQPYLRDDQQRTLREINDLDLYARERKEEHERKVLVFLQESLARQTTGLAPSIGDVRSEFGLDVPATPPPGLEMDDVSGTPSPVPRSEFGPWWGPWWHTPWHTRPTDVSDTSPPVLLPPLPPRLPDWRRLPPLPPRKPASGQLLGGKGLNIAGILNVFAFDSARQDGDSVQLTVRDSRGTILSRIITLTNAGSSANVLARRGIANVTITALNEGRYPPNTGGLRVRGSVSGVRSGNFNLSRGQSGTLTVRVLGR